MENDLIADQRYRDTMRRLEGVKQIMPNGTEFWRAREIHEILGYPTWGKFEPVIERATNAFRSNGIVPQHHIARTDKMVALGDGAQREIRDYFFTRAACYLIAMNGDPSKPEIAAAQAYFAVQTRRAEIRDTIDSDEKRLELREKVKASSRRVAGVAKSAGVKKFSLFHDARYRGLYGMALKDVKRRKKLSPKEQLFDRAGLLELSANDFQMNLAADVIAKSGIAGEEPAIRTNREVGERVRKAMKDSGATLPENLPLEEPIREVKKRLKVNKKASLPKRSS